MATRAEAIDSADLDDQERITRAVLVSHANSAADRLETRLAEVSADPIFGLQDSLPLILGMLTLPNEEVADAMPDVLIGAGQWFADTGERHRQGLARGWAPAGSPCPAPSRRSTRRWPPPRPGPVRDRAAAAGRDRCGRLARPPPRAVETRLRPGLAAYRDVLRDEVLPHAGPTTAAA